MCAPARVTCAPAMHPARLSGLPTFARPPWMSRSFPLQWPLVPQWLSGGGREHGSAFAPSMTLPVSAGAAPVSAATFAASPRPPSRLFAFMTMTPSIDAYRHVRDATLRLVDGLGDADMTPQSAEFASPAKWHLAHTTWFFEQFVLAAHGTGYRRFDERFGFLVHSYYNPRVA